MILRRRAPPCYVEDSGHIYQPARLDDEAYAQALAAVVVYCVDAMVIADRQHGLVALPKRRALPYHGYWYIGGRVLPGEPDNCAIARKFSQETGVALGPSRFGYVRTARYFWKRRLQEPQDLGCDMVGCTFEVELTDTELKHMAEHLDPKEYDTDEGLRLFTRADLVEVGAHPSILDTYDLIFYDN